MYPTATAFVTDVLNTSQLRQDYVQCNDWLRCLTYAAGSDESWLLNDVTDKDMLQTKDMRVFARSTSMTYAHVYIDIVSLYASNGHEYLWPSPDWSTARVKLWFKRVYE